MDTIRILLVGTDEHIRELFSRQLDATEHMTFHVESVDARDLDVSGAAPRLPFDVFVLSEQLPAVSVMRIARTVRAQGATLPILLLTKESEARVPSRMQHAGVDDMLNLAEINSPVFLWTFMSIIRQAEFRKKAEEFDGVRQRLQTLDQSLSAITHEINNPLSVIRLAIYNLQRPGIAEEKKALFLQLLMENVIRVDDQMKKLHEVRSQLGENTTAITRMLTAKLSEESLAS
jgi:DNA-binding response OmpR family regulator